MENAYCQNGIIISKLRSNFLVHDVKSKSISSTFNLCYHVAKLLDSLYLLTKELSLDEITKMSIALGITSLVEIKKTLVNRLLQLESSLHGIQWCSPLHAAWLGNILEHNPSSTLSLVLHQFHAMGSLFVRILLEKGSKSGKSLVITVEVRRHGQVDIAGIELHVDLLVDESLALLVVVLSDLGSHDVIVDFLDDKEVLAVSVVLSLE